MNIKKYIKYSLVIGGLSFGAASCSDYLDINKDPNAILDAPIEQVLTSATTSLGFWAGSDLHRYTSLMTQQFSGQGQGATTQNQEYERYNITGSDLNNVWSLMYSTILSDLELVIQKAQAENSPHYEGIAKIMQAYVYQVIADGWGAAPFTEALKFTANKQPKFDNAEQVYPELIKMLDDGIAKINAATSVKSPAANATFFTGAWSAARPRWERLANSIKLRLYLHQSKANRAFAVQQINAMVTANANFMATTADNFQMSFVNSPRNQNPIHQFELDRQNQFFPNHTLVEMMNTRNDPRRPRYFTAFPLYSNTYKGAKGNDAPSTNYSRMHIYLRGDTTNAAGGALTYNGTAPTRLLTYAEYCFIRAEAALYGVSGISADSFFRQGIRASMSMAGVSTAMAEAYIAANGTLTGTEAQRVQRIIEEKFVANYGVAMEPWTDFRRTGFPTLTPPSNAILNAVPRSFFYPQSEIDLNPNAPKQKSDMSERVFWDR